MTDHNDKELNEPLKSWKDEHDVSELIEKYDIKHPIYLILESDEKESKVSVSAPPRYTKRVRRNLKKMNEVDRLRYLEVFADSIHRYESLKVSPLPSQTDYGERLASFEHEHGRKPSKREKDQLLEDAENAIEMYTDEYEKLKSKVLEWNEKLQDKDTFLSASDTDESEEKENNMYRKILDAPEGKLAAKMALFQKVYQNGSFRNKTQAFKQVDQIYRDLMGRHFYKDYDSFESSQSQFFKKEDAQQILNKILKRLK